MGVPGASRPWLRECCAPLWGTAVVLQAGRWPGPRPSPRRRPRAAAPPSRRRRAAPAEGRSRGTRRDSEQQEHSGTAPKGPRGVPDGYCHAPRSSVRAPEPAAGLQRARYRYTNVMRAISAIAEGISGQQGAGARHHRAFAWALLHAALPCGAGRAPYWPRDADGLAAAACCGNAACLFFFPSESLHSRQGLCV
jgi:hypothetical protein